MINYVGWTKPGLSGIKNWIFHRWYHIPFLPGVHKSGIRVLGFAFDWIDIY